MMSGNNSHQALETALNRFETQLETPVVPGELPAWLQSLERTLTKLNPLLYTRIAEHQLQFDEMAKQDPGLIPRVEQLSGEDPGILAEAGQQLKMISPLVRHSDKLERDVAHSANALERSVQRGLKLVIRIRKQETAISTWYMEAFDRDRGVAD